MKISYSSFVFFLWAHSMGLACEEVEMVSKELAVKAYQENLDQAIWLQVKKYKVPLVYRESTLASRGFQQNNLAAKPQALKNKSSTLPLIEGLIPCNGRAGKQGDKLKKFEKNCPGDFTEWSKDLQLQYEKLKAAVHLEDQMLQTLDAKSYSCEPVIRIIQGEKQVVVYTDDKASGTQYVKYSNPLPKNVATVLTSQEHRYFTADTDLVVVGNPKGKPFEVLYDSNQGYRTQLTDRFRHGINSEWKRRTGNSNEPIQHGDESLFGLNPLDDVFRCYGVDGRLRTFDLTQANPDRESALRRYAQWIHSQSQFADIPIPSEDLQKIRQQKLKEKIGIQLDYSAALKDYAVIRDEINKLGGKPYSAPLEYKAEEKKDITSENQESLLGDRSPCASPKTGSPVQDLIYEYEQINRSIFEEGCNVFKDEKELRSNELCRKLLGNSVFVKNVHSNSEVRKFIKNVSKLDKYNQYHLLKNLLQINSKDLSFSLNQISKASCK